MKRLSIPVVLFVILLTALPVALDVAVMPAPAHAQEDTRQPAVVVSDQSAPAEDQAWTFRFLVPTVLGIGALALLATALAYAVRVRGRYRVVR